MKKEVKGVPYPFTLLNGKLQESVMRRLHKPTEIQRLAIPVILKGKSALLIAPTGSGKTEAALLPILDLIYRKHHEMDGVKLIYINPLKALTRDLRDRIEYYATSLGFKVRPLYGDVTKAYRKPTPDIIVTTPESLEIILSWSPKWWPHLRTVRWVIVDEVHELLMSKRGYQLLVLLERLKELTQARLQRIGLSATVGDPLKIAELLGGSDGEVEVIETSEKRLYKFEVELSIPETDEEREDPFLAGAKTIVKYVRGGEKTLIFTNSRHSAERLQSVLSEMGVSCSVHHGSIEREEREIFEDTFKTGLLRCLIATKTLELGIDIGDVNQVIQYRSPGQVFVLLQRAGRSKHKPGEMAVCKIVATDPEDLIECVALLRLFEKGFLERPIIVDCPLDVLAKEIMGIALFNHRLLKSKTLINMIMPITVNMSFNIVKRSFIFKNLHRNTFDSLLKYLISEGLVKLQRNEIILPGSKFWSVWRFSDSKANSLAGRSLRFNEFFSIIPKRETFTVVEVHGAAERKIGELDSSFVYRVLSTGMVIQLAGASWSVVEIDEKTHKVKVVKTNETGRIPTWSGEGPLRSEELAKEMLAVLEDIFEAPDKVIKYGVPKDVLTNYVQALDPTYIDVLDEGGLVIERLPKARIYVFLTFLGERINRALAAAIYEKTIERSMLIKYLVAPHGFAIRSEIVDPSSILNLIEPDELYDLVERHVHTRCPCTRLLKDQISEHFGFPRDETLLVEEAARQTLALYYDIEGALSFLKKLKSGEVPVKIVNRENPSSLAEAIIRYPFERPWISSLKPIIEEALLAFRLSDFEQILEYSWGDPLDVKRDLKELAKEAPLVGFFDLRERGWTVARVPLAEGWATIRVPLAVKYALVGKTVDIKEVRELMMKDHEKYLRTLAQEGVKVKITFIDRERKYERPYEFLINNVLPAYLAAVIERHVMPAFEGKEKVDLRIHVEGTNMTIIHHNVPLKLADSLAINAIMATVFAIKKGILSGKRQYVIELP